MGTQGRENMWTWGWGCGNMRIWGHSNMGTQGHENTWTWDWGHGDTCEQTRRGKGGQWVRAGAHVGDTCATGAGWAQVPLCAEGPPLPRPHPLLITPQLTPC